ncbi:hypothetical protein C5467_17485 [Photorhabdus khanii subsp. guanajuatensis]|uniref:Uncharacterized protein n=1 Tax=Photorhabdus khanii subsp. guanajuatensis TaxID=2100166 RepID=A0A4R4J6R8_9GAMM|nr:hypothetical protein C5467_17485 [Photorhabdus khanii subsp. guanajuatensis]
MPIERLNSHRIRKHRLATQIRKLTHIDSLAKFGQREKLKRMTFGSIKQFGTEMSQSKQPERVTP